MGHLDWDSDHPLDGGRRMSIDEMVTLARANTLLKDIAQSAGCSISHVHRVLRRAGEPTRKRGVPKGRTGTYARPEKVPSTRVFCEEMRRSCVVHDEAGACEACRVRLVSHISNARSGYDQVFNTEGIA